MNGMNRDGSGRDGALRSPHHGPIILFIPFILSGTATGTATGSTATGAATRSARRAVPHRQGTHPNATARDTMNATNRMNGASRPSCSSCSSCQ